MTQQEQTKRECYSSDEVQKYDIVTNWFSGDENISRAMQMLQDFEQTTTVQATAISETPEWLTVIDEALVGAHLGVADISDDYSTAKKKLNDLLCWVVDVQSLQKIEQAAVKTLARLGYTYNGGEQWKPPLGELPRFLNEVHQQARKPLTDEQIDRVALEEIGFGSEHTQALNIFDIRLIARAIEAAHGIKD